MDGTEGKGLLQALGFFIDGEASLGLAPAPGGEENVLEKGKNALEGDKAPRRAGERRKGLPTGGRSGG